jgi:hypothetical protein
MTGHPLLTLGAAVALNDDFPAVLAALRRGLEDKVAQLPRELRSPTCNSSMDARCRPRTPAIGETRGRPESGEITVLRGGWRRKTQRLTVDTV